MGKAGQPTKFKEEYCEMLIDHMAKGGTFKSFGADIRTPEATLYNWLKQNPKFLESKRIGEVCSAKYYENMGISMALGQIKRIVKETVRLDKSGKPLTDISGNVLYDREYAPATTNATIWVFMMKNMHHWRDNVNVALSGEINGDPIMIRTETIEEKLQRLSESKKVLKELEDGTIDITSIQRRLSGSNKSGTDGNK